jgi:hypothetical protein
MTDTEAGYVQAKPFLPRPTHRKGTGTGGALLVVGKRWTGEFDQAETCGKQEAWGAEGNVMLALCKRAVGDSHGLLLCLSWRKPGLDPTPP